MLIFLYGSDTFRLRQYLGALIKKYRSKNKSGLHLYTVDLETQTFSFFREAVRSFSLFQENKLVVARHSFEKQKIAEQMISFLNPSFVANKKIIIVFYENVNKEYLKKKNHALFLFLSSESMLQKEFNPLPQRKIEQWAHDYLATYGLRSEKDIIKNLINTTGNDIWYLRHKLDKIVAYAIAKNKKNLQKEWVELLEDDVQKETIFPLLDSLGQKKKKEAFLLLENFFHRGGDPLYLLHMFTYQFRNMLLASDMQAHHVSSETMAKKIGIHQYALKKILQGCKNFTPEELIRHYRNLALMDIQIKSGKKPEHLFTRFLVAL